MSVLADLTNFFNDLTEEQVSEFLEIEGEVVMEFCVTNAGHTSILREFDEVEDSREEILEEGGVICDPSYVFELFCQCDSENVWMVEALP